MSASVQVTPYVTVSHLYIDSLTHRVETIRSPLRDRPVIKPVLDCPDIVPKQSGMSDSKITMFAACYCTRTLERAHAQMSSLT